MRNTTIPSAQHDNTDSSGENTASAAEHKRLALHLLHVGLTHHGEEATKCIAAAQVHLLAALLIRIEDSEARYAQRDAELRTRFAPSQPPTRIRVFHNTNRAAMLDGYGPDDRTVEVFAYDEPAVTAGTTDEESAAGVYELTNVGDDPSFGTPDHRALEYRARRNRSLSVGDVIAINGRFYACASSGWTPISRPLLDTSPRPGTTPLHSPNPSAE